MGIDYTIKRDQTHFYFDRSNKPVLTVKPGQTVKIETERADNMVLTEENPVFRDRTEVLAKGANPVTGPIFVEGAKPGDKLSVSILEVTPCPDQSPGYVTLVPGPSGILPPFSLYPEFKPETIWCKVKDGKFSFPLKHKEMHIPVQPFIGTIGTAPAEERIASYWFSQEFLGNVDCPEITTGKTVVMPVNVNGALLSLGDVHVRQGHGEMSGCAVECRGEVVIRIDLLKEKEAKYFEWPQVNGPDYIGSVGCIKHSMEHTVQAALYDLVKRLEKFYGFELIDAYQLVATCVELEIGQFTFPHYSCLAKIKKEFL
ncbi:MAG: acetamidase/formamidase family protein [Bacillota bacterium]